MIDKKIFEIVIANDGTLTSVPNIALKQNENNSIFRIKTDALSEGGIIKLNFIKADDSDYAVQYATLSDIGVYDWKLQEELTSVAPDSANEIKLSISAIDYDEVIFTTLPITIALTQTNSYSPSVTNENTTDALSNDLNETIKKVVTIKEKNKLYDKNVDAVNELTEKFDNFTTDQIEIDAQQDGKINSKLSSNILEYPLKTNVNINDYFLVFDGTNINRVPYSVLNTGGGGGGSTASDNYRGQFTSLDEANEVVTDKKLNDFVFIDFGEGSPIMAIYDIETDMFTYSGVDLFLQKSVYDTFLDTYNKDNEVYNRRLDEKMKTSDYVEDELIKEDKLNLTETTKKIDTKVSFVDGKVLSDNNYSSSDKIKVDNSVQQEEGKGLSTNDFDNASKTAITSAQSTATNAYTLAQSKKSSYSKTDNDTTLSSLLSSLQEMVQFGRNYEGRTFIQLNFTTASGFKSFVSGTIDFFGYSTGETFLFQLTGPFSNDRLGFLTFECSLDTSYSLTLSLISDVVYRFSNGTYTSGEYANVIGNGVNSKVEVIY